MFPTTHLVPCGGFVAYVLLLVLSIVSHIFQRSHFSLLPDPEGEFLTLDSCVHNHVSHHINRRDQYEIHSQLSEIEVRPFDTLQLLSMIQNTLTRVIGLTRIEHGKFHTSNLL
jgi:hypothetical protein